jgi:hypothetical protein
MSGGSRRRAAGFSVAETLVAALVVTVVVGAAMALVAKTHEASRESAPEIERTVRRAAALAEIRSTIEDAAATTGYFDLRATLGGITRGSAGGASTPPDGYRLLVAADPQTWPDGFDPEDRRTWDLVDWWDQMVPSDPTTWYYAVDKTHRAVAGKDPTPSTGRPLSSIPHQFELTPVWSPGTEVIVGDGLALRGPCAVLPEATGCGGDQVGGAVMALQVERGPGTLRLGARLVTTTGAIRLVASTASQIEAVESLSVGDVLVITGREASGSITTSLVGVRSRARAVAAPTPARADGTPIFHYYDVETTGPGEIVGGYLRNGPATAGGAEYLEDATVARLSRDGAVVTFYTRRSDGGLALVRAVGDPRRPETIETLVEGVLSPLEVEAFGPTAKTGTEPAAIAVLRVSVPLRADDRRADPLEATINLHGGAGARAPIRLVWDTVGNPTATSGGEK